MRFALVFSMMVAAACGNDDSSNAEAPTPSAETPSAAPEPPAEDPAPAGSVDEASDEAMGDEADEVPPSGYAGTGFDPAPYAACVSDDECVALRSACFTAAVHRDRQAAYRETLRGVRFRCEPPAGGQWPEIAAACRDGLCVVVRTGN